MSEISVIIVTKDNSRYIDASGDDTVDVITRYAKFDKRIEIRSKRMNFFGGISHKYNILYLEKGEPEKTFL